MNTNPDEAMLALWLDDELTGSELAAVEVWADGRPEQLAAREEIRRWRKTMASAIPASEEPPYPDFFNSRLLKSIREQTPKAEIPARRVTWNSWLMPATACAGMALAFWVGKETQSVPEYDVTNAPRAIPVEPVVYTPESGVNAEWFASAKAAAMVIVLNGVSAIPDTMDFSETAAVPMDHEIDSMADNQVEP